jgi:hypothetical protein
VDAGQYAAICDRIALETEWLADVSQSMQYLKTQALSEPAVTAYLAVQDLANKVKTDVESGQAKADHDTTADGLELASESVEIVSLFLPEPGDVAGEFIGDALALAGEVTSTVEGDGQGESALAEPVTLDPGEVGMQMEQRMATAGAAFDHSWDMIVSDPAKLQTAYQQFTRGAWTSVPDNLDNAKPVMQNGVRHWAAGKFMAATYDVWLVDTKQLGGPEARDPAPGDVSTIGCDREGILGGGTRTWNAFRGLPADAAYYYRDRMDLMQPNTDHTVPRHGSNMWVLAQGDLTNKDGARYWPPQALLTDLYAPVSTSTVGGGYGWERPWLYTRGQRFAMHDAGWISSRCYWYAQDRQPYP